jgi:hypothetical protein
VEIIRFPNLSWELLLTYGLLTYSSWLVWRQHHSSLGLVSLLCFGYSAVSVLAPVAVFYLAPQREALLPLVYQLLGWPRSLAVLFGALALALALRSLSGQAPNNSFKADPLRGRP